MYLELCQVMVSPMPIEIDGKVYYRMLEACHEANIGRSTLLRWLKTGIFGKLHRDTRGWRLFTEENLEEIRAKANKVEIEEESSAMSGKSRRPGRKRLKQ